jgi:hypothetical protein
MTRRLFVLLAVLAAAVALYVVPAQAATLTITSDDVGWIQQNQPNGTHCGNYTYANGSGTQGRKASLQFPMSALPAGSTITAATLRVYAVSNTNPSAVLTAYDRDVTAFDACSITWNNFPPLGAQLGVSAAGVTKNQYKSVPLTTNLASIATTGRTAITVTTQVSSDLKFQSDILANPPKLDLTYTTGATTTTSSTTTTTAPPTCGGPITITTGGTYSGCYEDTNPNGTPAVTIATTQAVTLDRATVRDAGFAVFAQATTGTNVTISNSTITALNPGATPVFQRAIYLLSPASAVIEHNYFDSGHGVLINGDNLTTNPLRVRYNDYLNVGRWGSPDLVGAVHFDKVSAPSGAEVAWNRVINHRGLSGAEDVIGLTQTNGASGFPVDVHHNLIDGAYPLVGDAGSGYNGGAIDLGDLGGSWQVSHNNTVVRSANNGLMIPSGSNLHHYQNRVVNSGIADDGARVSTPFGAGVMVWDNPDPNYPPIVNSDTYDNELAEDHYINHRRWNGTTWESRFFDNYYLPNCDPDTNCVGGPQGVGPTNEYLTLGLTDDAAWLTAVNNAKSAWDTERSSAGVTVGPLP